MPRHKNLHVPRFELRDIYGSQQLHDVILIGRDRVFQSFDHATERHNGKTRGTLGYIADAGVRQSELARYIMRHRMKPFVSLVTLPSLPPQLVELENHAYSELVRQVHEKVLHLAIKELVDEHVVWHDGCVWNIHPDMLVEYRAQQRSMAKVVKRARRVRLEQKG